MLTAIGGLLMTDQLRAGIVGAGFMGEVHARAVRAAGGRVLVEDESTCTIYGMPRAIAEAGLAHEVLPLEELPAAIAREAA